MSSHKPVQTGTDADPSLRIADAAPGNWVDTLAPDFAKPYLKLARADRPIGTWLLLFPCWWGTALAHLDAGQPWINPWFLLLFAVGAFVMRGAGCAWNDIVDRDFDGRVARTALRPIPAGLVTTKQAFVFAVALSLTGFLVLIQFNSFTVAVGLASLAIVAAYPFAKRFTSWPQVVLGLAFNWGALVGYAAVTGEIGWPVGLLYVGAIAWTVGYDTIYAHQDREDDALLGLKSSALKLGDSTQTALAILYGTALVLWTLSVTMAGAAGPIYLALIATAGHFTWQTLTLDIARSENCLERFKSNRFIGWLLFAGLLGEILLIQI